MLNRVVEQGSVYSTQQNDGARISLQYTAGRWSRDQSAVLSRVVEQGSVRF